MDITKKWNRLALGLTTGVFAVMLTVFSVWILTSTPPAPPPEEVAAPLPPEMQREKEKAKAHTDEEFAELLPRPGETNLETFDRGIETVMEQTSARSHEENLAELQRKGEQLERFATAESVNQMATAITRWTGTTARATSPLENPPPGEVDIDTAQLHDVIRAGTSEEGYTYTAIMFDSAGRSMKMEMDAEEGKKTWETMQMVKKNPLMEAVYRKMVIPLMDKTAK